jgi:NADPH-dependent curcumin reductase CurA
MRDEVGLDVALNYKDADFEHKFARAVKGGIDTYFDNGELNCLSQDEQC